MSRARHARSSLVLVGALLLVVAGCAGGWSLDVSWGGGSDRMEVPYT